ncbi:hypothetical protein AHAS_Ahas11G0078800 [Arachis hypogaea]
MLQFDFVVTFELLCVNCNDVWELLFSHLFSLKRSLVLSMPDDGGIFFTFFLHWLLRDSARGSGCFAYKAIKAEDRKHGDFLRLDFEFVITLLLQLLMCLNSCRGARYHEREYWKFGESRNKHVLYRFANEDVSLGSWFIGLEVDHIDDRRLCCGTPPEDFLYSNKLGEGGFGSVYKSKLSNGQMIAVKRLSKDSGQRDMEFRNEVQLLAEL